MASAFLRATSQESGSRKPLCHLDGTTICGHVCIALVEDASSSSFILSFLQESCWSKPRCPTKSCFTAGSSGFWLNGFGGMSANLTTSYAPSFQLQSDALFDFNLWHERKKQSKKCWQISGTFGRVGGFYGLPAALILMGLLHKRGHIVLSLHTISENQYLVWHADRISNACSRAKFSSSLGP